MHINIIYYNQLYVIDNISPDDPLSLIYERIFERFNLDYCSSYKLIYNNDVLPSYDPCKIKFVIRYSDNDVLENLGFGYSKLEFEDEKRHLYRNMLKCYNGSERDFIISEKVGANWLYIISRDKKKKNKSFFDLSSRYYIHNKDCVHNKSKNTTISECNINDGESLVFENPHFSAIDQISSGIHSVESLNETNFFDEDIDQLPNGIIYVYHKDAEGNRVEIPVNVTPKSTILEVKKSIIELLNKDKDEDKKRRILPDKDIIDGHIVYHVDNGYDIKIRTYQKKCPSGSKSKIVKNNNNNRSSKKLLN